MQTPKVSVIMPVYNAEIFLHETIDSILCQSFTDYEFLIIDDGSSDKSLDVIHSYSDPRLRIYQNATNRGYIRTLNKLIDLAKGKYIARQDNDDISHPDRLAQQVDFLEHNLNVAVCGTQANLYGNNNLNISMPVEDADIRAQMIIGNPIIHPSVMMRKSLFEDLGITKYDESYCPAEDYAMWFEISKKAKLANLPVTLLQYRWHENSFSQLKQNIQIEQANKIRHKILEYTLSIELTNEEKRIHDVLPKSMNLSMDEIQSLEKWLLRIRSLNKVNKYYTDRALQKVIFYSWTKVCIHKNKVSYKKVIPIYFTSQLFDIFNFIKLFSKHNIINLFYNRRNYYP